MGTDNILISVICIVNDQIMFDGFLASLKVQDFKDYELIPIMNLNGEYDSARAAFNEAVSSASGRYILFSHPDIRFDDCHALADIISYLPDTEAGSPDAASKVPGEFGVCGAAGAKKAGSGREIVSCIVHGEHKERAGRYIDVPEDVQTLDECFFIIEKTYLDQHPFSDRKGWHLYSAEYCLDAIRDGRDNYVIPSRLWHISDGRSLNSSYVRQIEDLINKEKDSFSIICTTVKVWKTKGLFAFLYRKYYYVKQCVKAVLIRR